MTEQAGTMLVKQIAPRLRTLVPKSVRPVSISYRHARMRRLFSTNDWHKSWNYCGDNPRSELPCRLVAAAREGDLLAFFVMA